METTWFIAYEIISYLDVRETHHEPDYIKAMWCADIVKEIKLGGDCSAYFDRLKDELEYDEETVKELIDSLEREMEVYR